MVESLEIDRDRFRVAEDRSVKKNQNRGQDDGSDRVHVRNRIEREPARARSRVIAERLRDHAMHHLMQDDREYRGHCPDGDLGEELGQIVQRMKFLT
jgi:hypothetical protein